MNTNVANLVQEQSSSAEGVLDSAVLRLEPNAFSPELREAGKLLELALDKIQISLLPLNQELSIPTLQALNPEGPFVVCDCYPHGIEKIGTEFTYGYSYDRILNIDHHAPTAIMAHNISSTVQAIMWRRENGVLPESTPIFINHTDCDSILSSFIMRGVLPPLHAFGDAAVSADHTGEYNQIAELLQAIEPKRDIQFIARNLAFFLQGKPLDPEVLPMLAARAQERELARGALERGEVSQQGAVTLILPGQKISSEFFTPLFPQAAFIVSAAPFGRDREGTLLWNTKVRRGIAAPDGLNLIDIDLKSFDAQYGGRWNAGSTERHGGTTISPQQYVEYISKRIAEFDRSKIGASTSDVTLALDLLPASERARSESEYTPGIGSTAELNLRVSTAVLTRATFIHPETQETMIVLERKCSAELKAGELKVRLAAQPIGGASHLKEPAVLLAALGKFNYDSQASFDESDFRIQVASARWPEVRDFCLRHFARPETGVIETDVVREFAEEIHDALGFEPEPSMYTAKNRGVVVQEVGAETVRLGQAGALTKRVFNVFDVEISDPLLIEKILKNGVEVSDDWLRDAASASAKSSASGKAKVTALIAIPLAQVEEAFAQSSDKVKINGLPLIETVGVVLKNSSN